MDTLSQICGKLSALASRVRLLIGPSRPVRGAVIGVSRAQVLLGIATHVLWVAIPAANASSVPASEAPDANARYRYCGAADGCTFPGTGFTVCEAMLRVLNSSDAISTSLKCSLPPEAERYGFEQPAWTELNVQQHLAAVYHMDLATSPLNDAGRARRQLEFNDWQNLFAKDVQQGVIAPQLLQTQIDVPWAGRVTILGYDRIRCQQKPAAGRSGRLGQYLFASTVDEMTTGKGINAHMAASPLAEAELVRYRDAYYFVQANLALLEPTGREILESIQIPVEDDFMNYQLVSVYKATGSVPGRSAKIIGVRTQCQLIAQWPRITNSANSN